MKKLLLAIMMVAMCAGNAYASCWNNNGTYNSNCDYAKQGSSGIGFIAGSTYGLGIGFRHKFKNSPIGIQIGGFPLMGREEGLFTGGVGMQFTLHSGNYGRAFLSLSGSVMHAFNGGMGTVPEHETYTLYAVGPGVGIEWKFLDNFSFVFDIPAATYFDSHHGYLGVYPIPNTSFMFTW
jgi:hypothetical protein